MTWVPAAMVLANATRTEAAGLIEALKERLLTSHSATSVLEAWCAERHLGDGFRLSAEPVRDPHKVLTPVQRRRLDIGLDEPVRYRRVRLVCGPHVLSEADNWYVPARLTPEMNAILDTTQTPFGRVVHPLGPIRRHLALRMLWTAHDDRAPQDNEALFAIDAVLSTGSGVPFCEVAETYKGAVLLGGPA